MAYRNTYEERLKCYSCGKFIRYAYDSRVVFGGAGPEGLEPHDPDYYCRKCSTRRYKELLKGYECCKRSGDYEKSDAEVKAAKKAGLTWIGSNGLVDKFTGRDIHYEYIREKDRQWVYIPYLEYHAKRRKENRCKCWRKFDERGNCPTCSRAEVYCLCKYDYNYGEPF